MNAEIVKLVGPLLILGYWGLFAMRVKKTSVILVGLFFASYAGFSSNFNFAYRELHQIIQLFLILITVFSFIESLALEKINKTTLSFLFFIGISLFYNQIDIDSNAQLINYISSICVVNFLFSALFKSNDLDLFVRYFAKLSVLLALLGFLEFALTSNTRIEATFSNPNYYGLFLGVGSCFVYVSWHGLKRNIAFLLIIVAIVLCGSRSAIIFPVIQVFWVAYRSGSLMKIVPIVTGITIIIFLVMNLGLTRFTDTVQTEGSDAERIVFAKIALMMAIEHPFTGVGWGRFISEFGNYSPLAEKVLTSGRAIDVSGQDRRVTHNDFLRILAELGWLAFILSITYSFYGVILLVKNNGFGLDYLFPSYLGILLFSLGHNNMNSAFFWFFYLLPFYLNLKNNSFCPSVDLCHKFKTVCCFNYNNNKVN